MVSRSDIFPAHHGAAVKIERTAWGLSFHLESVVLLTDWRDGYWVYRNGERSFHHFPLKVAARVPVVTTHKGREEIDVEHARHLLVIDDPDAMAEAVAGLLADPGARQDLAEAAAQWVSRFDC